MVDRLLRYTVSSAVVWLVFLSGYLCRDVLGDWLISTHSGTIAYQIEAVSFGLFRVFLTCVLVSVVGVVCGSTMLLLVGILNEVWYQVVSRRVVSLYAKQRANRAAELVAESESASTGPVPRMPVSARKHANRSASRIRASASSIEAELASVDIDSSGGLDSKLPEEPITVTILNK